MSPFPLILSSPSGAGKTTIARELLRRRLDVGYSVSCTTRMRRPGERDGLDYHFVTSAQFDAARASGDLAESAEVHGELYGTLRSAVDQVLQSGRHVVMDIDVQGAGQLAAVYPQAVLVFILPPSSSAMLERLRNRGTESGASMARRLKSALSELQSVALYHYVVVNEDLEQAVGAVSAILDSESSRVGKMPDLGDRLEELRQGLERELSNIQESG